MIRANLLLPQSMHPVCSIILYSTSAPGTMRLVVPTLEPYPTACTVHYPRRPTAYCVRLACSLPSRTAPQGFLLAHQYPVSTSALQSMGKSCHPSATQPSFTGLLASRLESPPSRTEHRHLFTEQRQSSLQYQWLSFFFSPEKPEPGHKTQPASESIEGQTS